jgi:hypothetical protein
MTNKPNYIKDILWWELRRLFFNFVLLVSGLLLLFLVQTIKPIYSHLYFKGYFDLIIAYALFANLCYTTIYIFILRLTKRFDELTNRKKQVKEFTFWWVIIVGLIINSFAAGLELAYRIYI